MVTGNNTLDLFISLLLGFALHILIKMNNERKRAEAAGLVFLPSEYLKKESLSLGISIVSALLLFIIFPQAANNIARLQEWSMIFMASAGYMGSSIMLTIFGKTGKWINSEVKQTTIKNESDSSKN